MARARLVAILRLDDDAGALPMNVDEAAEAAEL